MRCHAQICRNVFEHEHDQFEELRVKHLTVNDELSVVFLHHLANPVWNLRCHISVGDLINFLFFLCYFSAQVNFSDGLLEFFLVNEHVG